MLKVLLRARLAALFSETLAGKKKRRTIPLMVFFALLILYAASYFVFIFVTLFKGLGTLLLSAGSPHTYFAFGSALALFLMLVGSVIYTKKQLYVANDNELLLSMPIPPHLILVSRLLILLIVNLLLMLVVAVPMVAVWCTIAPLTVGGIISLLLVLLLLPVASLSGSALIAYLVAGVEKRIRRKSLLTTLLVLLILIPYFALSFLFDSFLEGLVSDITPLIDFFDKALPLAVLGRAMLGSLPDLLIALFVMMALVALVLFWLSRTYIRTVLENRGDKRIKYRERALASRGALFALTARELRHLGASAGYMLNAGLGLLLGPLVPILLLFGGEAVLSLAAAPELSHLLLPIVAVAVTAPLATAFFSAVTVSLEGRNLWIVRTSPVPTRTVLQAKLLFHLLLTLPFAALSSILWWCVLGLPFLEGTLILLLSLSFCFFTATFGLACNLLYPKLEWKNEVIPVKQGAASLLAMLGGMVIAVVFELPAILLGRMIPPALALLIPLILFVGSTAGLYTFIMRGGIRRFEAL